MTQDGAEGGSGSGSSGARGARSCPSCAGPLRRSRSVTALRSWTCGSCRGIAAEIASLRGAVPRDRAALLEREIRAAPVADRPCPSCRGAMRRATVRGSWGAIEVDGCTACHVAWFDAGELRSLRARDAGAPPVPGAARDHVADAPSRIERLRAEAIAVEDDLNAALLGVILGIPYPEPVRSYQGRPLVTWLLSGLVTALGIAAFGALDDASLRFGMIPDAVRAGRWTGLLTHFFVHADIFHLAGNLLFLLMFGARIEALLGWPRFLLILVTAVVAGALAHAAFAPAPSLPLVGASGGVSGVLAAHACLRPRSKVRLMRYFRMITVPASVAFAFWIALQLVGTAMQFTGASPVSALAHLGGAAAGFLIACLFRGRAREVEPACA